MSVVDPFERQSGTLVFSAPAKTILFGEHAVVYNRLAVAGAIDLRTQVELKFRPPTSTNGIDDQIEITMPDLNFTRSFARRKLLEAARELADQIEDELERYPNMPPSLEYAVPIAQRLLEAGNSKDQPKTKGQTPAQIAVLVFLYVAIGVLANKEDPKFPVFKIVVSSEVPVRVGLGSSGAFCVPLCASLLRLAGLIQHPTVSKNSKDAENGGLTWEEDDLHKIERWATAAESIIHGKSSGLDACICTRGGVIKYRRGDIPEPLLNPVDLRVLIVNTKVERNTVHMVETVQKMYNKFPTIIDPIFDSIEEISVAATKILTGQQVNGKSASSSPLAIKRTASNNGDAASLMDVPMANGNLNGSCEQLTNGIDYLKAGLSENGFENLQELCRINNHLLNALGVGHAKISQICALLGRYGIHAKLSGAGGGGTVFAMITRDASPTVLSMIESELTKMGFELWKPNLGAVGVQQHFGQ